MGLKGKPDAPYRELTPRVGTLVPVEQETWESFRGLALYRILQARAAVGELLAC